MSTPTDPAVPAPKDGVEGGPEFWEPTVAFLKFAIGFVLAGSVLVGAALLLFAPHQVARATFSLAFGLVALAAAIVFARGRIRAAFILLGVGVWVLATGTSLMFGGTQAAVGLLYPLIILLAGWLFSTRAAVLVAAASAVAALVVALLEQGGHLPQSSPMMPAVRWIIPAFVFALTAVLIHYFVRAYRSRLGELRASEARLRSLSRLSSDWFWEQDAELRFVSTSGGEHGYAGITALDHVGRRRWELPGTQIVGQGWEDHQATLAARRSFRDLMLKRTATDGTSHYVSVSGEPVFDAKGAFTGYRGVAKDVTERFAAEQQARAAEALLRDALENLGEMVCLTDAGDRIVLANRRMLEFNAPVAEHLAPGRGYDEHLRAGIRLGLFPDADGREEDWVAERMAMRRTPRGPVERRRQDGRWLLVDDQVLPDGSIISWGVEVTEAKRADEALRNLNADLERRVAERTAQLEASNRELESFSYSVSHDLRAPLRAVTGFSKLLLEQEGPKLSAEAQRYLGIIDANGRRMGSLIDALLALGRYTRVELNKAAVDMGGLAQEVADELAPSWPGAKIEVGPLPTALGNATLLKQVLLNLVGNALKYSATVPAPRVVVGSEGGRYVVRDNGVGFDMAYADKLFKPFERLHTEREFQGTGIGLAIVKLIVERHGGQVEAHATEGGGASFSFTVGPG